MGMDKAANYIRRLERALDCPKSLRRPFLDKTRRMAEDFLQNNPDASSEEVADYLGEPNELAQGFLETLDQTALQKYRRKKKIALFCCMIVLAAALIAASSWILYRWNNPLQIEATDTIIIYSEPTEGM